MWFSARHYKSLACVRLGSNATGPAGYNSPLDFRSVSGRCRCIREGSRAVLLAKAQMGAARKVMLSELGGALSEHFQYRLPHSLSTRVGKNLISGEGDSPASIHIVAWSIVSLC